MLIATATSGLSNKSGSWSSWSCSRIFRTWRKSTGRT